MIRSERLHGTSVLTLRARLGGWSAGAEAKLWDELVTWCESQQLFIGGGLDAAVLYALDADCLPRRMKILRNLLLSRMPSESFELVLSDLQWLASPMFRQAAIEAVASAQLVLLEHALDAAHAFAAIRLAGAVRPHASASTDGTQLTVTLPTQQLVLSVRRADGEPEPLFEKFPGRMRVGELHDLIGEATHLRWKPLAPASDLWAGDWATKSGRWHIHAQATTSAEKVSHAWVFRRLAYVLAYTPEPN